MFTMDDERPESGGTADAFATPPATPPPEPEAAEEDDRDSLPSREESEDSAAERAEQMGVLKAIDSSVKIPHRTEGERCKEVRDEPQAVLPASGAYLVKE